MNLKASTIAWNIYEASADNYYALRTCFDFGLRASWDFWHAFRVCFHFQLVWLYALAGCNPFSLIRLEIELLLGGIFSADDSDQAMGSSSS